MVHFSSLFWAALFFPGYALLRRFDDQDAHAGGILPTVALSYFLSFAILTPISIVCYLLEAPLAVFSVACVTAFLAALIDLTVRRQWGNLKGLLAVAVSIELAIVLIDLIMGARVGTLVGGDGPVHVARVRSLVTFGFQNHDPFVAGEFFFPIYHTNLYHALHAACCQITGIDPVWMWFGSLAWAKLMVVAGPSYLAWVVFERRSVAWVAGMFMIGQWGAVNFMTYPNKLAPFWICPVLLGVAVRMCLGARELKWPAMLATGSIILGQVHALYAAFIGIVVGPLFGVNAITHIIRKAPAHRTMVLGVLALVMGLPFVLVARTKPVSATAQVTAQQSKAVNAETSAPNASRKPMKPFRLRRGWGALEWRTGVMAVGLVLAMMGARRHACLWVLAMVLVVMVILYVPPVREFARDFMQRRWIMSRMGFILTVAFVILGPCAIAFWISERLKLVRWTAVLSVLALGLGACCAPNREPTTWQTHLKVAGLSTKTRHGYLETTRIIRAFTTKHIPRDATVLCTPWQGLVLGMIHDCSSVATERGSNGVPNVGRRRRDLASMLDNDTPWSIRRELFRKYNVRYFLPGRFPTPWVQGHLADTIEEDGLLLFVFDLDS